MKAITKTFSQTAAAVTTLNSWTYTFDKKRGA
jgi:hypothetical protein